MAAKAHEMLFSPVQVGPITLEHRIVMAPMTRQRSQQPGNVPGDLQLQYYTQRASDGGLIIAEGTAVSPLGHGGYGSPGLWTDDQVSGWTHNRGRTCQGRVHICTVVARRPPGTHLVDRRSSSSAVNRPRLLVSPSRPSQPGLHLQRPTSPHAAPVAADRGNGRHHRPVRHSGREREDGRLRRD